MSSDMNVAKRYAKALFAAAQEKSAIQQVEEDLRTVVQTIDHHADLKKMLLHPNIDSSVKKNLLKGIFEGKVSEIVYNLIQLLVERRRESILPSLLQQYVSIADEALGQASATVFTPVALSEAEMKEIARTFGEKVGKTVRLEAVIDPSLLGGLKVQIGDRLYDGSIAGKLARLQKTLLQSQAL